VGPCGGSPVPAACLVSYGWLAYLLCGGKCNVYPLTPATPTLKSPRDRCPGLLLQWGLRVAAGGPLLVSLLIPCLLQGTCSASACQQCVVGPSAAPASRLPAVCHGGPAPAGTHSRPPTVKEVCRVISRADCFDSGGRGQGRALLLQPWSHGGAVELGLWLASGVTFDPLLCSESLPVGQ